MLHRIEGPLLIFIKGSDETTEGFPLPMNNEKHCRVYICALRLHKEIKDSCLKLYCSLSEN